MIRKALLPRPKRKKAGAPRRKKTILKLLENDLWTGVRRSGRIVLIIFDAQDLNVAKAFLTSASESIKE